MHNGKTWELPSGQPAELELHTEWGTLAVVPVEPGQVPRLELSAHDADELLQAMGRV